MTAQLAAGKRPAQLTPAAVRLLAAVATAGGRAEHAGALRRDLKHRWQQELDRLRAALELAAAEIERQPAFEEAVGLAPPDEVGVQAARGPAPRCAPPPLGEPGAPWASVQSTQAPEEPTTRTPEHLNPGHPNTPTPERLNARTPEPLNHAGSRRPGGELSSDAVIEARASKLCLRGGV